MTDYGFAVTIQQPFDQAVDATRSALAEQGFGVLTEIDVAATMKTKLDVDLPPHLILGACNPPMALRAIRLDPSIGMLLPCNVVVRALDDTTTLIEAMDPQVMTQITGNSELAAVADDARTRLQEALAALSKEHPVPTAAARVAS